MPIIIMILLIMILIIMTLIIMTIITIIISVLGLFFLYLFSQLSSLGMESGNYGEGLAMEQGIWGRVGAGHGLGVGNSALDGGDAPSPFSIPAGHGVNMESPQQLDGALFFRYK